MGLDMYAHKIKADGLDKIDLDDADKFNEFINNILTDDNYLKVKDDIHYWRKHPDLHGLMEAIYNEKGGFDEFNCVNVALTSTDLDNIESIITSGSLPHTEGFFFGSSEYDELSKKDDLEFVKKAREAIEDGFVVYYSSWW